MPPPSRLVDDQTLDLVYERSIRPFLMRGAAPAEQPKVVLVGGQPGAGKTSATLTARDELAMAGRGVAYINGDELRPFHPRYEQLVRLDKTTAAERTGSDVGLWVERGIREAAAERYSSVIETTMRQPDVVVRTARAFAQRGFQVELDRRGVPDGVRQAVVNEQARFALRLAGRVLEVQPDATARQKHVDRPGPER